MTKYRVVCQDIRNQLMRFSPQKLSKHLWIMMQKTGINYTKNRLLSSTDSVSEVKELLVAREEDMTEKTVTAQNTQ